MKNILSLFLVISLFSFLIFTGCGDDAEDLIKGSLKVTVKAADANVYQAGKEISYTVEISSNNKLKELIVTPTVGGEASTPTTKDLNNEYSLSYEYKFTIPSTTIPGTSIEITYAVEDAAEKKTEKVTFVVADLIKGSLKVTVKAADANVYQAGKEISYSVKSSSDNKLEELIITPTVGGVTGTPTKKDLNKEYSLSYDYKLTIPSAVIPGTYIEIAFAVEDAAETITEKVSFKVVSK